MKHTRTMRLIAAGILLFGMMACKSSKTNTSDDTVTLTGDFQSMQGVMNPVSCYCGNPGYLTTPDGTKTAVCFENREDISCKKITVTGKYVTKTVADDPNSPCPAGQKMVLQVSSWKCK